jgi:hypothetical protein
MRIRMRNTANTRVSEKCPQNRRNIPLKDWEYLIFMEICFANNPIKYRYKNCSERCTLGVSQSNRQHSRLYLRTYRRHVGQRYRRYWLPFLCRYLYLGGEYAAQDEPYGGGGGTRQLRLRCCRRAQGAQGSLRGTCTLRLPDPGCLSRGSKCFLPGSRIRIKEFKYSFQPPEKWFLRSRKQGFGSESGSGSAWIRINLSCWIRIRIRIQIADPDPDPGGQKIPTKIEKSTEFSCFEVLDVLFRGLKASPVAWASFMEALG